MNGETKQNGNTHDMVFDCSFIIEFMFSFPGMGQFFVQGVTARDYSMVMGLTGRPSTKRSQISSVATSAVG